MPSTLLPPLAPVVDFIEPLGFDCLPSFDDVAADRGGLLARLANGFLAGRP